MSDVPEVTNALSLWWWLDHANIEVHHHNDAEVVRNDAQFDCDRQQVRGEDEELLRRLSARDRRRDLTWNPLTGEHEGHENAIGDDAHDRG